MQASSDGDLSLSPPLKKETLTAGERRDPRVPLIESLSNDDGGDRDHDDDDGADDDDDHERMMSERRWVTRSRTRLRLSDCLGGCVDVCVGVLVRLLCFIYFGTFLLLLFSLAANDEPFFSRSFSRSAEEAARDPAALIAGRETTRTVCGCGCPGDVSRREGERER